MTVQYTRHPTDVPYIARHVAETLDKNVSFNRKDIPIEYCCYIQVSYDSLVGCSTSLHYSQCFKMTLRKIREKCLFPLSFEVGHEEKGNMPIIDYRSWLVLQLILFFRPESTLTHLLRKSNRDIFLAVGEFFGVHSHFHQQIKFANFPAYTLLK